MKHLAILLLLGSLAQAAPDGTGGHHGGHHGHGQHHAEHHGDHHDASHGTHHAAPHHATPQHAAPQHAAPQHGAPQHAAPHHAAPHHAAPQQAAKHHATHGAPQHATPQHGAPQHAAPHHAAPQHGAPQHAVPQHGANHHAAPQHAAPQHAAPHHAAPQHKAPQHGAPQHAAPHHAPLRAAPRPRAPPRGHPQPHRAPQRAPFQRQVPRRRPSPFFKGPPRLPQNPFLTPGNPRPERSNLRSNKQKPGRFPPQKPGRQPLANSPQIVPTKNPKPVTPGKIGKTLAAELKENDHFSTLYTALKAADLLTTLDKSSIDYTLFAPTNAAFDKVPVKTLNDLLGDKEALRKVMLRHVIPNKNMFGKDIPNGDTKLVSASGEEIKASRGKYVQMTSSNGKAFVVKFDFPASNGVYHAVDQVL